MANNFFGITDIGRQRDNNEDTFIAQKSGDGNFIIACVIDGVGGYVGGEVAADIARECILEQLSYIAGDVVPLLVNTINIANQKIYDKKKTDKQLENMACVLTLAVIDIQNNQFYYAHVGDTRLYLLRDHTLIKISKDHSFVGFLEDSGRLTEEAAMDHPKRNEINKALGFNPEISKDPDFVETGHSPFLPGDTLLVCSDGLTDLVDKSLITAILTGSDSIEEKGKRLIDAANSKGGKDNVTVALVQNDKAPRQHSATRPATAVAKVTDEIVDPLAQPKLPDGPATIPVRQKSNRGSMIVLFILLALALAGFLWQFWLNYQLKQNPVKTYVTHVKVKNAQEIKLQDTINKLKGKTLILSAADYPEPIVLTDSLHIDGDSLYIKAKGNILFKRDSLYHGPALTLAATCKFIVLDSVAFEGFKITITTHNDALVLKHVVFNNCEAPVQTSYSFPANKQVSGRLFGGMFKIDSLPGSKNQESGIKKK
ncbi:Serine/threonine protein phosphatase PrpC [Mucilaginibacter lappiensis]|uniref:Serine/threonine protein phosphatase PrpC n=1 Tax=Mucilaginibacter lappiensis TaxID=354630 RepID=A0ABR6PH14_9SPHI|nr:protein phosphatase 2C domain-containing protein [Mucilaginibacter lappiensis]MBB6109054.1 serine/threonine protein phosphatase PrpC [Mucilaginibacter lappiensis]SIQ73741.1 Serine/threonine protein phosphatase PrpC [Mucilaginibacter lappiensis]